MNRRTFILLSAALPLIAHAQPKQSQYAALGQTSDGRHLLVILDASFEVVQTQQLAQRAHGLSLVGNDVIIVDRRPGSNIYLYNLLEQRITHTYSAPDGYYLNGHAVFSGGRIWATANNAIDSQGVILGFNQVGDIQKIELNGFGPHELIAEGASLYCAVSGIKTDSKTGEKIADEAFESFVVRVSTSTGDVEKYHTPTSSRWLSQRHICWHQGSLYVAGQTLGGAQTVAHYLLRYTGITGEPVGISAEECSAYLGSISSDGDKLYISSPKAGARWVMGSRGIEVDQHSMDLCGLAGDVYFTGTGMVGFRGQLKQLPISWDNHALLIS